MAETNAPAPDAEERREFWKVWGAVALLVALVGVVAAQYMGDPPPKSLVIATGVEGGGYDTGGVALRDALAADGIDVELRRTAGSLENQQLLRDGQVDVAFVQGGTVSSAESGRGLTGVASLYPEPLWIFVRDDVPDGDLSELRGRRLQVGAPGSGTLAVARQLLAANGVDESTATFQEAALDDAVAALLAARSDALFMVVDPGSPRVRQLFVTDGVRAFGLSRSVALSRRFRFLQPLQLTPGMIDLDADLPVSTVPLVAPTAGLLIREDLHPALVPLLYEAARARYGAGGLFADEGEFPNLRNLDVPAATAAVRYERSGPSFLYRVLPFQLAATIDRLKIMLLPLLTLLLPLLRVAPPIYRWRIRSKIFKWYKVLLGLEQRVRRQPDAAAFERAAAELEKVAEEIASVRVPLGYAEELYNLRMHIRLVRREFAARSERLAD